MRQIYDIAAKPTYYGNRLYRSRLECRWAAFFDLCGISFEYEPIDLHKWSPDFGINIGRDEYLIEIKPMAYWNQELMDKIGYHKYSYNCLLFHEEIIKSEEGIIAGKIFITSGDLLLDDYQLKANPDILMEYWNIAANKSMFLKPSI